MKLESIGWGRTLLGHALSAYYRLFHGHRYDNFVLERVGGRSILVTPNVFNPKLLRTGEFFAGQIDDALIPANVRVLDMGTGSGVCALAAARHAKHVIAVDINEAAVRCAGINALMHRLEHKIEVRRGDLFEPVKGERFDVILFNPPFIRGAPRSALDRAWRSPDAIERFAAGLDQHLAPAGYALVLLSTFGDAPTFTALFEERGFTISTVAVRRYINETAAIFKVQGPRRTAIPSSLILSVARQHLREGQRT